MFIINKYNKRSCRSVEQLLYTTEVQHLLLFIQKEKQPILREIKAAFPDQNQLMNIIEQLINLNIIQRHNRRYSINYPVITYKEWEQAKEKINPYVQQFISDYHSLEDVKYAYLIMMLCREYQTSMLSQYPLLSQSEFPLNIIKEFKGKREQWLEVGSLTNDSHYLLDYFDDVMIFPIQQQHQQILSLIGDVNSEFFLHHCLTKLKRAQRRGQLIEDYNIFNDCLEQLHYLEQGKLNIPILQAKDFQSLYDNLSLRIDDLLSSYSNLSLTEQLVLIQQLITLIPEQYHRMIIKD